MASALLLCALAAASAAAGDKEQFLIYNRAGITLEWERKTGEPAKLKIKNLEKKSAAAKAGYEKKDEIIAINGEPIGDRSLRAFLLLSRRAESFTVRRKKAEMELPPLFRADTIILSEKEPAAEPGQRAPAIKTKLPEGTINILERALGSVVVVNFWATWCKPCIEELPFLRVLQERYRSDGLLILCVNLDDDRSALESYLKDHPLELPLVRTPGFRSQAAMAYGVRSIPANVVVDREGYVVSVSTGSSATYVDEDLTPKVEGVLRAEYPALTITAK